MTLPTFRRRATAMALIAALALLAACNAAAGVRATPTARVYPTATPTALPTVLYAADWSQGADGWTLPAHWSIQRGALVNDGGGTDSITVPYTVTATDYEVDMVARMVNIAVVLSCGNIVGMEALDSNGNQLYYAQVYCIGTKGTHHPAASLLNVTAQGANLYATADFAINPDWKTYRVQVHGKGIRFFPNSSAASGGLNAPVPLAPATFRLLDSNMRLEIMSFTVLQLKA